MGEGTRTEPTTLGALAVGERVLRPFFLTVETVADVRRVNGARVQVTFASGHSWRHDPSYAMARVVEVLP